MQSRMVKRGIVVTDFRSRPSGGVTWELGNAIPRMKRYLLYWDQIEYAQHSGFSGMGMLPDVHDLVADGIITRTALPTPRSPQFADEGEGFLEVATAHAATLYAAFKHHSMREPGQWSMAQEGAPDLAFGERGTPLQVVEVELLDFLLEPAPTVAFEQILKFKEKRKSELQAFRDTMNKLYSAIANSHEPLKERVFVKERIERTLGDLNRAMQESFVTRVLKNVKIEVAAGLGAAAYGFFDKKEFTVSIAGGAIAVLCGALRVALSDKTAVLPAGVRDFLYVYQIQQELRNRSAEAV